MNCNFSHDRCAANRFWDRLNVRLASAPTALWTMASVCLLVPLTVGCHVGGHQQVTAHHPAYGQLEQGCFGYEPTIWRTMASDCQQAVRLIPNPVIVVPEKPAVEESAEDDGWAPPQDTQEGGQIDPSLLDIVPDSAPLDVPGIVRPDAIPDSEMLAPEAPADAPADPPVTVPPVADPPTADPPVAEPPAKVPPALQPRATGLPPAQLPTANAPQSEPEQPEQETPASLDPPISRAGTMPVITAPVQDSANVSARELFRTIDEALGEAGRPKVAASSTNKSKPVSKPVAGNLSRFISY